MDFYVIFEFISLVWPLHVQFPNCYAGSRISGTWLRSAALAIWLRPRGWMQKGAVGVYAAFDCPERVADC